MVELVSPPPTFHILYLTIITLMMDVCFRLPIPFLVYDIFCYLNFVAPFFIIIYFTLFAVQNFLNKLNLFTYLESDMPSMSYCCRLAVQGYNHYRDYCEGVFFLEIRQYSIGYPPHFLAHCFVLG